MKTPKYDASISVLTPAVALCCGWVRRKARVPAVAGPGWIGLYLHGPLGPLQSTNQQAGQNTASWSCIHDISLTTDWQHDQATLLWNDNVRYNVYIYIYIYNIHLHLLCFLFLGLYNLRASMWCICSIYLIITSLALGHGCPVPVKQWRWMWILTNHTIWQQSTTSMSNILDAYMHAHRFQLALFFSPAYIDNTRTALVSVYPGYGITGIWTPRHVDINAVPIYNETQKSLSQCLYDCQSWTNCRSAWHNESTCKLYQVNRYSEDEVNGTANFIDEGTSRLWEYYDTGKRIVPCH